MRITKTTRAVELQKLYLIRMFEDINSVSLFHEKVSIVREIFEKNIFLNVALRVAEEKIILCLRVTIY